MNRNKAYLLVTCMLIVMIAIALIVRHCKATPQTEQTPQTELTPPIDQPDTVALMKPSGNVIETPPANETSAQNEKTDFIKDSCFLLISKTDYKLYVYEKRNGKKRLLDSFPVCYAKNKEQKTRNGDFCTPECTPQNPFHISEIKDASTWCHDFKDGRGEILAYGHWFLRLDLSQSFPDNEEVAQNRSIGIHGSTNNEKSVPGNGSEGCVRLRDEDIETLHDKYAFVGQTVIIEPYKYSKPKKQ